VVKLTKGAKAALGKARKVSMVLTTTATAATGHKVSKTTNITLV
jgi:hypothetical protein